MRKKILSTLLMGAFIVVSMSMFTSCKDYDDDITANKTAINDLRTKLDAQVATLNTAIQAAQQAANDAKSAAATAQAAGDAGKALAQAAQQAAEEAKAAALKEAKDRAEAIKKLSDEMATKADQKALEDSVADLVAQIEAVDHRLNELSKTTSEGFKKAKEGLDNLDVAYKAADANLQNQINALNDWKKLVEAMKLDEKFQGYDSRINDLQGQLKALKDQIKAAGADYATQTDVTSQVNAAKEELKDLMKKANSDIDQLAKDLAALAEKVDVNTGKIKENAGKITENTGKINDNTIAITKLQNDLKDAVARINILEVYIAKQLTSIVLKPSKYFQMMGAIDVMKFDGLATYEYDKTAKEYVMSNNKTSFAPDAHAVYHLNPSTADITDVNFSFVDVETQNIQTRAHNDASSVDAKVKTAVKGENGLLDVTLSYNADNVNDANRINGSWVSTLALQAVYPGNGRTITSDYAVLMPTFYKNLLLGNKNYAKAGMEFSNVKYLLQRTGKASETEPNYSFAIPYDEDLDLNKYIQTLYNAADGVDSPIGGLKAFTDDEFAHTGMTYTYELYEPSTIKLEGSTLNGDHLKTNVGKSAVVRVLLKTPKDKVVAVGYVKVLITDKDKREVSLSYTDDLVLNCKDTVDNIQLKDVVDQLDGIVTLDDFLNVYEIEPDAATQTEYPNSMLPYAKQTDGTFNEAERKGVVCFVDSKINEKTVKVLMWTFDGEAIKSLFYNRLGQSAPKTVTTTVKFKPKDEKSGYVPVYVTLTLAKEKLVYPTATIDNAKDKIVKYWFTLDSDERAIVSNKYDEIHANVSVPKDVNLSGTPTFDFNMLSTFTGGKIDLTSSLNKRFTKFTDKVADIYFALTNDKRIVKGASGAKYQLYLNIPADVLFAVKVGAEKDKPQVVARIKDGIVSYQKTAYALDVLNYMGYDKLGKDETFTAHMIVKNDRNCLPIAIENNQFNVRFLRPVNVTDNKIKGTKDAVAEGGANFYAFDMVSFTDWRNIDFSTNPKYYMYYGVKSIKPNLDKVRTDINNNKDNLLKDVAPDMKLTWHDGPFKPTYGMVNHLKKAYGYLHYINNGAVVNQEFNIFVPLEIEYSWGKIYTTVTLKVDPTIAQPTSAKRF